MSWQLIYTHQYTRRASRFIKQHPEMLNQYAKTLALLEINPHHPALRLHSLKGSLEGLYSVSINLKYRLTLEMLITEHAIVLINIGDHDQVY